MWTPPPAKPILTFVEGQQRVCQRPVGMNPLERFAWLNTNFPGFNDRWVGGSAPYKIAKWYGLTTPQVKALVAWVEGAP